MNEFTSVSEGLPKNDLAERYLVLIAGYYHDIAVYSARSPGKWFKKHDDISAWVTHWMPLPKPAPDCFYEWLLDGNNPLRSSQKDEV